MKVDKNKDDFALSVVKQREVRKSKIKQVKGFGKID
jgi:hypothetical protein